jgi:hypothetical protein
MSQFHHLMQSSSRRRTALASALRVTLGALVLASTLTPESASAQTQLGTITVSHPAGGGFWMGRWDTTAEDWEWIFTDSSGGYGTYVGPPPPSELCPALEDKWENSDCPSRSTIHYNGCGPEGILSWAVPDAPMPNVSFYQACNRHDACYVRIGATQAACDSAFGADAMAVCNDPVTRHAFRVEAIDLGLTGAAQTNYINERIYACRGFATIYQGAVMAAGAPHFRLAQATSHCTEMKDLSNENGCGL